MTTDHFLVRYSFGGSSNTGEYPGAGEMNMMRSDEENDEFAEELFGFIEVSFSIRIV